MLAGLRSPAEVHPIDGSNLVGNKKRYLALGGAAILLLSVAACGSNRDDDDGGRRRRARVRRRASPYTLGTTDTVTALDPAGSYDLGSSILQYSVFQTLLTIPAGENTPQGDAAETCEYDDPQTLTCTLKEGLKFSNGNDLTSSDVKYSFERALNIADPNGAAIYLLGSIGKVVDGHRDLGSERDRDAGRHDGDLPPEQARHDAPVRPHLPGCRRDRRRGRVPAGREAGRRRGDRLRPLQGERSTRPASRRRWSSTRSTPATTRARLRRSSSRYFQDPGALKLAVEDGDVDIAYRSLSPTDLNDLKSNDAVTVAEGAGAEIRYWVSVLREPGSEAAGGPPGGRPGHRPSGDRRDGLRRHGRPAVLDRSARPGRQPTRRSRTSTARRRTSTRPSRPSPTPGSRRRST